jgi:4'-phosphopantetheinyl transferase
MFEPTVRLPQISSEHWLPLRACSWQLRPDEVHLWRVDLRTLSTTQDLDLTDDERERAARFLRDEDRQRFVHRRSVLRQLLGRYERLASHQIRFVPTQFGKPRAFAADGRALVAFSMTSRGRMILLAFGREELGVDVEDTRQTVEIDRLALRFFHADEATDIQALPEGERRSAFFHCWSRKEAYVKAIGRGLHLPLDTFRVSVLPDAPELVWRDRSINDQRDWMIRAIVPRDGYVGALVHHSSVRTVRCFTNDETSCEVVPITA